MTSFQYTAAIILISAQLGGQPLYAASELEPIGDQLLRAGQLFSLVIKTTDLASHDETVTSELSVDTQTLPDNAVLLDNLDGSRTFMWIPDDQDSGDHVLIFHLKNNGTSETTHQQSITLTIASSDKEYQRLMQERQVPVKLLVEDAPPPGVFPTTVQKLPPTITETIPAAIVKAAENKKPESAEVADTTETENNTIDIVVEPSIVMADTLSLTVGGFFEQEIKLEPVTSARHTLRLLNRPVGLALIKYSDSAYSLSWLPDPSDAGTSIVIVQLIDVDSGAILDSQRLKLEVREQ